MTATSTRCNVAGLEVAVRRGALDAASERPVALVTRSCLTGRTPCAEKDAARARLPAKRSCGAGIASMIIKVQECPRHPLCRLRASAWCSRWLLQEGWQIGEGGQDMVGCAAGTTVSAGQVLARFDQCPGEPVALGGEHVGFDVIAHHQGV